MQMHVTQIRAKWKDETTVISIGLLRIATPESPAIPLLPAYLRSFAGVSHRRQTMPDKNAPASGFQYSLTNLKPAEPMHKVALTFPDGAKREFPKSITGTDIARGISPSLAKRTVAMALDGVVTDLADPTEHDARIEFIARDDPTALEPSRHTA